MAGWFQPVGITFISVLTFVAVLGIFLFGSFSEVPKSSKLHGRGSCILLIRASGFGTCPLRAFCVCDFFFSH